MFQKLAENPAKAEEFWMTQFSAIVEFYCTEKKNILASIFHKVKGGGAGYLSNLIKMNIT